jgi:hypothetical protein
VGGNTGFSLTGNNNIVIGYNVFGLTGESNTIRIGNTGITDTYIAASVDKPRLAALPSL